MLHGSPCFETDPLPPPNVVALLVRTSPNPLQIPSMKRSASHIESKSSCEQYYFTMFDLSAARDRHNSFNV